MGVTPTPVEDVATLEGFDAVVVGSSIYTGRWLKPAKELVERNAEALRARPVWLFSSGPLGDPPKPEADPADTEPVTEATGGP
jgi:menaquinone-dependent protoporphyrinogen oxidase